MRDGWIIRKVKEICDKASSNIAQKEIVGLSGDYPVYGASGYVQNVDFFHRDKPYIGIVKDGSGVGRVNTYPAKTSLLGTLQYIIPKDGYLLGYVAYLLKSLNLAKFATGAAIPHIYFKEYGECKVPVPPIAEQEKIVAELDCLTGIIEKKKQQLEELDKLAQSIFYDMFGDPESSPYPVKALGVLSKTKLSYGSGASAIPYDGRVRYVRITDIDENGELNNDIVSPSAFDDKYLLHEGDLLFARSGATVGKTYLYRAADGDAIFAGYLIRVVPDTRFVLPKYIFSFTRTGYYRRFIGLNAQAVAQPNINAKQYGSLKVVVPPLDLQNEFAKKVEAIEKQKEMVKRSIVETETLFNSRMDYWFN